MHHASIIGRENSPRPLRGETRKGEGREQVGFYYF
jgi:hypothetical protein